jgi:hypothetical protein
MSFALDIDEDRAPVLLDTANTGITRTMEHGLTYLSNAGKVWQMIDPAKAARLARMRAEELQFPPHRAELRLGRDQVERLIELLQGIETASVGKLMAQDYHVLPDKIDYVNEHAPGLAVRTTDAHGNAIYVLDKITEIEWLRAFLQAALDLDRDVIMY